MRTNVLFLKTFDLLNFHCLTHSALLISLKNLSDPEIAKVYESSDVHLYEFSTLQRRRLSRALHLDELFISSSTASCFSFWAHIKNWVIWSQLSIFYFNHVETKYLAQEAFVDRRALGRGWAVHLRLSFSFLLFLCWTYERQGNQTPITPSKPSVFSPCEGSKTQTGYVPAQCCPVGPAIEEEDKTDFWSKV